MSTIYEVLRRPLVTEKTNDLLRKNQYVFEVEKNANRTLVKDAVEKLFNVSVVSVNMILTPGKATSQACGECENPAVITSSRRISMSSETDTSRPKIPT